MNSEEFSCIKQVVKTVQLSVPLMFISNEYAGITGVLDSWRRQYVKQLEGIVVSYKNVSLASRYGCVSTQRSYAIYNVKAAFDLFCPSIGDIVKGKINRVSREHIGCLIQETINVNIHLSRNSPSGLSKYIYLDREILFEISHFSCETKGIRVTGDITPKCIELMDDLFPVVEEDDASFAVNNLSAFGDENNASDREVNLSILNSVKTSEKVKKDGKSSKKRKRESESSVSESPTKGAVKVEVKTPKKKKRTDSPEKSPKKKKLKNNLDEDLTTSPVEESPTKESVKVEAKTPKKKKKKDLEEQIDSTEKTSKKKKLKNSLDVDLTTSPEKSPKKKKSKKKKDLIKNNIVSESPTKEIKSNPYSSMSDSSETDAIHRALANSEHLKLLESIKTEVASPQTPTKSKGPEEKNKKKRKREEEGSTSKKDKKRKKKNKDGAKDKKKPSKKKSKMSAAGTVLKKDKKKSKAKKLPKKDDKSKSSKSKKNRKKDKSDKRKSKKLKLSTDNDIKDVIKEIKEE